jgi:precorrin-2 dehydrogenase/sirohydrochlorin ferrochelatase
MIPIYLDPAVTRIALIGNGALAIRRLAWLEAGGAAPDVWSPAPTAELLRLASRSLAQRLPNDAELGRYHVIWIADLAHEAAPLALRARELGVLVNVEDVVALCDFHTPAVVRRGKLTLAAGTGGASPAATRAARERLEQAFPSAWESALEEIARSRTALRAKNASFQDLVGDARERLARHNLI